MKNYLRWISPHLVLLLSGVFISMEAKQIIVMETTQGIIELELKPEVAPKACENFEKLVDIVIDGGIGGMIPSTIVDCTTDDYTVIREGAGLWEG